METRIPRSLNIPRGPRDLTAEWLTEALRSTGTISGCCVKSFDSKVIGEGAGLIGQLVRVTPRYDRPEPGAPRSLVAKLPAEAPENREIGNVFRLYEREVRFYQEIAGEVELRTPRRYYSAMDIDAGDYVLLLEDLAPARLGDQIEGCSVAEAELALRELAKFHATWWDSPRLNELDWMPFFNDAAIVQSVKDSFKHYWAPFLERFSTIVPPYIVEIGESFPDNVAGIMGRLTPPPRTIVHGDYRLDNLFFGGTEGADALAAIDWQISARGRGVFDVAYFLAGSLHFEERQSREMDLLRVYHHTLTQNGVTGYGFEQCLHDYRLSILGCLIYAVIAGGSLDFANERGAALATCYAQRHVNAIVDLNAGELMKP